MIELKEEEDGLKGVNQEVINNMLAKKKRTNGDCITLMIGANMLQNLLCLL